MPGFNPQQLAYKVQSGNTVVVMIGDQTVAFCQTADNAVDFGTESLYGIGTAKPQEIQQLKFAPTLSVNSFILTETGLSALNYPANLLSVLANNSFDMHILDINGLPLITYTGAVAANFSMNVPTNAILTENITFQALDVLDSTGQSILNGNFALTAVNTVIGAIANTVGL